MQKLTLSALVVIVSSAAASAAFAQDAAAGKTSFAYHAAARPAIAESEAVSRGLFFSRVTGSPIYFVHLSSPLSVDLVTEARGRGIGAIAETCPHFLTLDASRYLAPDEEAIRALREEVTRAVKLRLRADVPVGSCLSGGVDSTSIVGTMAELLRESGAGA